MKKLHQLAKALKDNGFEMNDSIKEQFEEYLSLIAEGSRILHPRFGLGTVKGFNDNSWIEVNFDKDVEKWALEEQVVKEKIEAYKNSGREVPYSLSWSRGKSKPSRSVMITSCHSIHMMLKREMQKDMFGK